MADEEISFQEDAPVKNAQTPMNPGAREVVAHFSKGIDLEFPGPEDVEKLAETPLAYTEICEPMLKELFLLTEKRKEITGAEKDLKKEFAVFLGLERGMIQRGQFGAQVVDTKGKRTTNWKEFLKALKAWAKDQIGKETGAEIDALVKQYTSTGEEGIKITPYMVGKEPVDEEDDG